MIIGPGPSQSEMKAGQLTTGQSGELLKALVKAAGLDEVYYTNMLCWQKQDPTPEHFEMCRDRLEQEIKLVQPKVIFTLGKIPAERATGREFGQVRASAFWHEGWNCWVIPTHHPNAALATSSDDIVVDMLRDFKKTSIYSDRPNVIPFGHTVVEKVEEARNLLSNWPKHDITSLDVETYFGTGVKPDNVIACLAIGNVDHGWVFTEQVLDQLKVEDWPLDLIWTFHNGMFDIARLYERYGFWMPIMEDSMFMSYSLDNRGGGEADDLTFKQGIHGLKRLAAEYEGAGVYNINTKEAILAGRWSDLYKYNAMDAVNTARLATRFKQWQIDDNMRDHYLQYLIPMANILPQQRHHGTPVDLKVLGRLAHKYGNQSIKLEDELINMAFKRGWPGPKPLNPRSSQQLGKFLYDICEIPLTRLGRTTKAEALELIDDPFVALLSDIRHTGKLLDTYIIGIDRELDENGRVHPEARLHGTVTGRLSYVKPPVQTIPSDYGRSGGENYGGDLRDLFAAQEGFTTFAVDYEQAELWSMYFQSNDQVMLEDLLSGDFHTAAAAAMFDTRKELHSKPEWQQIRFQSKFVTFGVAFGRSADSLSKAQLKGRSVRECQMFIDNWYARYHTFRDWVQSQKRLIVSQGEQVTVTGRKFRYPTVLNFDNFRKCINYPIQSVAHDHLILANLELHPLLNSIGAAIWFDVHDALLGEIPIGKEDEACRMIQEVMETPRFGFKYGIPAEIKLGRSWQKSEVVYKERKWVHAPSN